MEHVFSIIRQVAPSKTTVLIEGESGTGKELVAQAIHSLSGRPEINSWLSTVRPFPPNYWKASCSAMKRLLHRSRTTPHRPL